MALKTVLNKIIVEPVEAERDDRRSAAVNRLERAVNEAHAQLNRVRDEERPAFL